MKNKGIKNLGIFLAIFLILIIVSFSIFVISFVFSLVSDYKNTPDLMEKIEYKEESIKSLDFDLSASKLIIVKGDINSIETNNSYIKSEIVDNVWYLKEKKHYFYKNKNLEVIISLKDNIYDSINLETGAGKLDIESLKANKLIIKFGAGSGVIQNLEAFKSIKIKNGVGAIDILDGELNNLDLDLGVGRFFLTSNLKGDSKIEAGIGELIINLKNNKNDYKVDIDKGIGSIYIDGVNNNLRQFGTGSNTLKIKGGIGKIDLNFDYNKEENNISKTSNIKVLEYFKNNNSEYIIVGNIESGYFTNNEEIGLYQDEELILKTTFIDETNRYTNSKIEDSNIGDKVFIKVNDISEEQLKLINNIRK